MKERSLFNFNPKTSEIAMTVRFVFASFLTLMVSSVVYADVSEQVLVDNFGPGDSFDTAIGYVLGGGDIIEQGTSFTVTKGSFVLDSVDVPIGFFSGNINSGSLTLYSEVDGNPGVALDSVTLAGFPDFGGQFALSTFNFSQNTILQEGETYFLIGSVTGKSLVGDDSILLWGWNNTGDERENRIRFGGGPWEDTGNPVAPAFRVVGTAIPEPSSMSLLLLFGSALTFSRQKKQ